MVIGHDFVWAHLGKTGGDATLALFRLFPRIVLSADNPDTNAKHATFRARKDEIAGKRLILNIRRLDAWALSHAQHRASRGLYPDYKPMPLSSPDEMADSSLADDTLSHYLDSGRIKIDRWFRTEYLALDFLPFVSELTQVTPEERDQVLSFGMINAGRYDHDLANWFTPEQRERLYKNNPLWAAIERELYDRPHPAYTGFLDAADNTQIVGWVWDKTQPDASVRVNILEGEKVLASAVADLFRKDLLDAKIGSGRHAFVVPTPPSFKDGRKHEIRAIVSGTNFELRNSPLQYRFAVTV
jgi:hypothetical protein